eukprot:jgi/Galph1/4489/GphlegSOOS_G3140.1
MLVGLVIFVFWKASFTNKTNKMILENQWSGPSNSLLEQLEQYAWSYLDEDIKILSSDEMEGRGVGTEGERKSAAYIVSNFQRWQLQGAFGNDGLDDRTSEYYQQVPLEGVRTQNESHYALLFGKGNASVELIHGETCSLTTDMQHVSVIQLNKAPVIFGGYCMHAPQSPFFWDDFESVSVKDRVVLCLVNQPVGIHNFTNRLTYYGRWTYKLEELRRRGATGVILLHTEESAGYGWNVIRSGTKSDNIRLRSMDDSPLSVRGWISSVAWNDLVSQQSVPSIQQLEEYAKSSGFRCTDNLFDLKLDVNFSVKRRYLTGYNVGAKTPGIAMDPSIAESCIVVTSHYDHLGKKEDNCNVASDCVYHGALDNASGVAKLLVLARIFGDLHSNGQCCQRCLIFLSPTAEEAVLLGSAFYMKEAQEDINRTIAAINFDGMNVWGCTKDMVALGEEYSTLGDMFRWVTAAENLATTEDPEVHQGHLYRSDQFSFFQAGIPSLKITHGKTFCGQENDYFDKVVGEYLRNRYHQVNDDYEYIHQQREPYVGAIQELRVAFRLLYSLAQGQLVPQWKQNEEIFKHIR